MCGHCVKDNDSSSMRAENRGEITVAEKFNENVEAEVVAPKRWDKPHNEREVMKQAFPNIPVSP